MSKEFLPDAEQQQFEAQQKLEEKKLNKDPEYSQKIEKIQTIINKKKLRTGKLDCVIVMDLTQSMDPYIEKMQKELCAFINEIKQNNKELDIQFGFVGYKDFCDDPDVQLQQSQLILSKSEQKATPLEFTKLITGHLSVQDFSNNLENFQKFLMQMYAEGGGDIPEDVAGGLHQALQLSWRSDASKIVILVSDQPTHGQQYQQPILRDDYPKGHPFGIQLEDVITTYAKMNAMLLIFKITDNTEKMFEIIKNEMKQRQAKVRTIDLRKALKREQEEKKLLKMKKKEMEVKLVKEKKVLKKDKKKAVKKDKKGSLSQDSRGSLEDEGRCFKEDDLSDSSISEEEEKINYKIERKRSVCSIVNMKIADKINWESGEENLSCNEEID